MKTFSVLRLVVLLVGFGLPGPAQAQQLAPTTSCQPQWLPTFGQTPGTDGGVVCFCDFDDGSGPALYAGGGFLHAGGVLANSIARWDGSTWSRLGPGMDPADPSSSGYSVFALCVFDDGTGSALYAGGDFISSGGVPLPGIARWNGSQWSPLGSGLAYGTLAPLVRAVAVFDDGSGPALYAGGWFTIASGQTATSIARWDGSNWSPVGTGMNGTVDALCVFDDGSGPALYAGGSMTSAGGVPVSGIARWDGSAWSSVGSGVGGSPYGVLCLHAFDDGSGSALFAGGAFSSAGGTSASHVAKWNGSSWSALGSGTNGAVKTLEVFDNGSGPALYVGGDFQLAGGLMARNFARWSGTSWSAGGNLYSGPVNALAVFDDGSGRALHAGGGFFGSSPGSQMLMFIAKRSGNTWTPLGQGIRGITGALLAFDDGSGPALYAGGMIQSVGTLPVNGLAKWNGSQWSALGPFILQGSPGFAWALCDYDDGGGHALYVAGSFTLVGSVAASRIVRWNGTNWSPMGSGLNDEADSLYVFDDGSGPALYAGGWFTHAGAVFVHGIAKWNGSSWSALGAGLYGTVYSMCAFDDGSGQALYAAGSFTVPGGGPIPENIAKWDGTSWTAVGGGVNGPAQHGAYALAAFDDGSGPALYVGGRFDTAGTTPVANIAKWDGVQWSGVGAGLEETPGWGAVGGLSVYDDGSGPALYVSGRFRFSGTQRLPGIARWRGGQWSGVGGGVTQTFVEGGGAFAAFDDGTGPALFLGGNFGSCSGSLDSYLAKWGMPAGCSSPGVSICEPGSSGVVSCPCSNPPGALDRGCDNSSATGGAQLTASGVARVTNDTLVFTTSGETPSALSLVLQGDALNTSGAVFGQGVRCVAGTLKRLYVKTASAGSITAPGVGDASVHARSAALGDTITQGSQRYYGVFYRDPVVLGGCPATSTFNITQQLDVRWQP
jgi:hypothetical protein